MKQNIIEIRNLTLLGCLLLLNTSIIFKWINLFFGSYLYGCFIGFIIGLFYYQFMVYMKKKMYSLQKEISKLE